MATFYLGRHRYGQAGLVWCRAASAEARSEVAVQARSGRRFLFFKRRRPLATAVGTVSVLNVPPAQAVHRTRAA